MEIFNNYDTITNLNRDNNDVLNNLNKENILDDINNYNHNEVSFRTIPISPICFVAGSLVKTDQGLIEIEKINIRIHTIRNIKIKAITKTLSSQSNLICFEKDSIANNIPNKKTILTPNHKVLYKNKLIKAEDISKYLKNVNSIQYNNELLYNILLDVDSNEKIIVNNMITESLDPNNIIALLYKNNLSDIDRNNIILNLNKCVLNNNIRNYVKIYKKLHKSSLVRK